MKSSRNFRHWIFIIFTQLLNFTGENQSKLIFLFWFIAVQSYSTRWINVNFMRCVAKALVFEVFCHVAFWITCFKPVDLLPLFVHVCYKISWLHDDCMIESVSLLLFVIRFIDLSCCVWRLYSLFHEIIFLQNHNLKIKICHLSNPLLFQRS